MLLPVFLCLDDADGQCSQAFIPCPLKQREKKMLHSASICQTSSTSQVTEAERSYTVGARSCLQPSRFANNLQTQAVLKPDEQWRGLSVAHRSSDVGDTPGTS